VYSSLLPQRIIRRGVQKFRQSPANLDRRHAPFRLTRFPQRHTRDASHLAPYDRLETLSSYCANASWTQARGASAIQRRSTSSLVSRASVATFNGRRPKSLTAGSWPRRPRPGCTPRVRTVPPGRVSDWVTRWPDCNHLRASRKLYIMSDRDLATGSPGMADSDNTASRPQAPSAEDARSHWVEQEERKDKARRWERDKALIRRKLGLGPHQPFPRCPGKARRTIREFELHGDRSHSDGHHRCSQCSCRQIAKIVMAEAQLLSRDDLFPDQVSASFLGSEEQERSRLPADGLVQWFPGQVAGFAWLSAA